MNNFDILKNVIVHKINDIFMNAFESENIKR